MRNLLSLISYSLEYYYNITHCARIKAILEKLSRFLVLGVTETGSVKYNCTQTFPEVFMFSGVVGAALASASTMGLGNYNRPVESIYDYLVENQRADGSFSYSTHDAVYLKTPFQWGFLTDKNSYPGPLSFMLQHLLIKMKSY